MGRASTSKKNARRRPSVEAHDVEELAHDHAAAEQGDTRARARVMARALGELGNVPAPVGDPIIERMWKVFKGTAAARRLDFMRSLDLYAGHVPPEHVGEHLRPLLLAWKEEAKAGPRKTRSVQSVWELLAAEWKRREGEDVAPLTFKRAWSRLPLNATYARPRRPRRRRG
jgi:hypothetical protein